MYLHSYIQGEAVFFEAESDALISSGLAALRRMRAPIAWKVPLHMPFGSSPSRRAIRSLISPAALLVNVTARIRDGSTPWCSIRRAMRVVSTRVLPEPAPARTSIGPSKCRTASRWAGFRPARGSARSATATLFDSDDSGIISRYARLQVASKLNAPQTSRIGI